MESPKSHIIQAAADTHSTKATPSTATPADAQQEDDAVIQFQGAEEMEMPSDLSTTDADDDTLDDNEDADEEAGDALAPRSDPV